MPVIILDVSTHAVREVAYRLNRLAAVTNITNMGAYREDKTWTKLHVETTLNIEEFDNLLYRTKFNTVFNYATCEYTPDEA